MMRSAESNMRKPCTMLLIAASVSSFCVDSCLFERPVPQIYAANAVLSRRPQSSTTQPAVWLAGAAPPVGRPAGPRPAGSRDGDSRRIGISDVELAGPVRAGDERGSRLWPARGRAGAPAMEVERRGSLRAVIPRIEVEIEPRGLRRRLDQAFEQDARLEACMDKAEKITSAILDRVVRHAGAVDRQHDKKPSSIADAADQRQMRTGSHSGAISGAFESFLSCASVVEIEAIYPT